MNIREISIARLKEYENNPRNNDLAVEKVKYSIERFGFLFPVVVDMNYTIVCGHTRVRACREMGIQAVPCIIADELTEDQINLFRLVDNKTSEYSDWDFEKLKNELSLVDLRLCLEGQLPPHHTGRKPTALRLLSCGWPIRASREVPPRHR